jgi:hypothetical protein
LGYTSYFARPRVLPVRKVRAAVADGQKVVVYLAREHGLALRYESDSDQPPEFTDQVVRFNGVGDDGHETFEVPRALEPEPWQQSQRGLWFNFCKTARKPYDLAVCCCLIVLHRHFEPRFVVTSDGDDDEANWPLARQACQAALGFGADFELPDRRDFGRMGVGGIPVGTANEHRGSHVLANGWVVRTRVPRDQMPSGAPRSHRAVVYANAYVAQHRRRDGVVLTADTLAEARRAATVRFLEEKFGSLPEAGAFLAEFKATFDWAALAVYADRLAELGEEKAERKLRALLPRRVLSS